MASIRPVKVEFTLHGGPPLQVSLPEAANQTFVEGEAVYLDGDGRVAEYTASIDDGTQRFLGFAAQDGHNNATAGAVNCQVLLPKGTVFSANATSAGSNQATAIAQVGVAYPMYQNTTNGVIQIDIADTGSQGDWVRVYGIHPEAAVGESNGRLLFTIVNQALQIAAD